MGKLFIVSTPIGNLGDITYRAIKILESVDVILTEDTRSASKLLGHYNITHKKVISFFEGNEERRLIEVITLIQLGKNVALISESGTPLVSDPGFKLVRELVKREIDVESIPGPTALIAALTISGLPSNSFLFLGFLPKKEGKAKSVLEQAKQAVSNLKTCKTAILYESPHRLLKTLNLMLNIFGDEVIVVARELTKIHEEIRREKIAETIAHFEKNSPRGEFTICFCPSEEL